jgi:hypothetical protein
MVPRIVTSSPTWAGLNTPSGPCEFEIGERRLVELRRPHRAVLGQVVHDHIDEFNLIGARCAPGKRPQSLLSCLPVHAQEP